MNQYLLNETFAVDGAIASSWVDFMHKHCLCLVSESNFCQSHIFSQIAHGDNEGAQSFALQIVFNNEQDMIGYNKQVSPQIIRKISTTFAGQFASFKTVMEIIENSHQ
jgi:hypothetical protein